MKKSRIPAASLAALLLLAALPQAAHAAVYYWDDNAAGAGFGTAGASTGTWAAPTAGPTAGWSLSATGANAFAGFTTGTGDTLNFGNGATGLGAGTITVSGTQNAGTLTFATGSGAIILSGGTLSGLGTINVNGSTATISSVIANTNVQMNTTGAGTLVLSGDNTFTHTGTNSSNVYAIRLTGATVVIASDSAFGVTTGTDHLANNLVNLNGAPLQASGSDRTVANPIWLNGSTTVVSGSQSLTFKGAVMGRGGSAAVTNNITGAGTLSFTGNVYTDNAGGFKTLTFAGTGNTLISGNIANNVNNISGQNGIIIKNGAGTLTLSGTNTYSGVTTVNNTGLLNVTGTLTSNVTVNNTAFLSGTGTTTGTLTLNNGTTIVGTSTGSSFKAQTVTANATVKIAGSDGSGTIGSHTIGVVRYNTGTGPNTANFSVTNYHAGATVANVGTSGGETQLTYTNEARTWNSASSTWDVMNTTAWTGGDLKFGHGDALTFDDTGTGGGSARAVTLNSLVTPGSVTFNNSTSTPYTVSGTGGTIAGPSGLTKSGNGTVTLSNVNTYTGTTTVSGGTLLVNGSLHASSAVSVANTAILGGSGKINGTVSVTAGGTILLGASSATLALTNSTAPTYNVSGSTYTTLKILASASTLDKISASATTGNSVANVDLVIDTTGLSGDVSSTTIYSAGGAITGPFHSVTANNGYTATLDYSTPGLIKLALSSGGGGFTVTFDSNGGTGSMAAQTASTATALTTNTFTRTGYTFAGWNTVSGGGGTAYADGASYPFTASTTLYAQWTINSYTVTFNNNGGSGTMTAQTGNYNTTAALTSNTFTNSGFTFIGWNTAANNSGTSYADGANYTFTASTTLYAQWIADNTYLVTYNANSATSGTAPNDPNSPYSSSATVTVLANTGSLARTGFTFAGWNTANDGSGTHYDATGSATFSMPANNVTLFAEWTINTYTVTFNNNGGSGTMTPQTGNYNTTAALTSNTFTRTGYTFAGWNTVSGGGGTAYANGANYTFTASTTLYAQWTATSYTVTFDGNGGGTPSPTSKSVTYDSTYGTLATVTRTGYTFNGWFTATSGGTLVTSASTVALTGAQTLYAQWTATPTITLADTLVAVNTTYGTASATPTSFHVSGSGLTGAPGDLTVTPPSGYEVSLSSGSGYSTSLPVPYSSDTLASTQVFVRLAATSGVAGSPYSGTITVSGGGASSQTLATASSTVAKADATVVVTPYTVDYDGNPHTATVTSITGVLGQTDATVGTVTLNTTHTNAGTYASDSWSFTPTANYNTIGTTTTPITVLNKSFETTALPNNATFWWALGSPWVGGISPQGYEVLQVNQFNTFTAAADGIYAANLESWLVSVTQNLSTTVNAGDTLSMTFSGGRDKLNGGGKFTATFKVGTTEYTSSVFDTTLQGVDTWQTYTFTQTVGAGVSGNLSIIFKPVSGRPWLDNISDVSRTSGTPQTITNVINKATPTATLAVNNSPVTYDGSAKAATVGITSSAPTGGSVTNILTGGAATQTAPGTYAVTADYVPADTANYETLTGLAAGDFVITATPYINWAYGTFTNGALSPKTQGGNPDGDTLINLQEYAFGTDPTDGSSGPGSIIYVAGGAVTTPGSPVAVNLAVGGGVDYRAVFGRRKDYVTAGLTYTVQFSVDFTTWTNSTDTPTVLTGAGNLNPSEIEAVSVPYPWFIPYTRGGVPGYEKPTFFRVEVSSSN